MIPGEIRDKIYALVFEQYEDHTKPYPKDAIYRRPGYEAPLRIDRGFLETCQRVYREAGCMPIENAEQVFWLHRPYRNRDEFPPEEPRRSVVLLDAIRSFTGSCAGLTVGQVTIFASVDELCGGSFHGSPLTSGCVFSQSSRPLRTSFNISYVRAAVVTVTIRHFDWLYTNYDSALRMCGQFVNQCRLPNSVKEFRMDLETVSRKQVQVDDLAEKITQGWHFRKGLCSVMSADKKDWNVRTWSGTSIIDGERWIGDEVDDKPGVREYYVKTIIWKPNPTMDAAARPEAQDVEVPHDLYPRLLPPELRVCNFMLDRAGVQESTPVSEAKRLMEKYQSLSDHNAASNSGSLDSDADYDEDDGDGDYDYDLHG